MVNFHCRPCGTELAAELPDYMIPAVFVPVPFFPLSPSGKIDRLALPDPDGKRPELAGKYIATRSETERLIAGAWKDLLPVDKVGLDDNFFDLGGHSLLLIRLATILGKIFHGEISVMRLFEHPTVREQADFIRDMKNGNEISDPRQMDISQGVDTAGYLQRIAVIGMACRFPGAVNTDQYWENIRDGVESIRCFTSNELDEMGVPPEIYNAPNFVRAAPVIDDIDKFDASFFGYSPREAEIIDPQQRIFLECAWTALENAGYDPGLYQGRIGVFGGAGSNYYRKYFFSKTDNLSVAQLYETELGNENDYLATRVAYKLGLRGPALTIQTACSTSLVAAHIACQNLLSHQCDMALAGGVSINVLMKGGYFYEEGMIPSPDGHCRAFDAKAQGTVAGQGAGVVVLKRLSDAIADRDKIYAVIRGSAINNDGTSKVGFTAPSIAGQSEAILAAQAAADVGPEEISYVEAHGTGTPLGDPIEIKALTRAFRISTDKRGYCPVGSVKTNIGHLDTAAGVAGLIKTVLMLEHKEIPPSLHFKEPNPNLDLETSPFFINTQLREWQTNGKPRRACVSAFGLGGTNAHMILEEAPLLDPPSSSRARHVLTFSARTEEALNTSIANMATYLEQNQGLNPADVAFTLQVGRKAFAHRGTAVCSDMQDAIAALRSTDPNRVVSSNCEAGYRDVVFMFSGQGSQYVNMGLDLYKEEPVFKEQIDYCSEILQQEIAVDLRQLLYPSEDNFEDAEKKLEQTIFTQPALFTIEFALAKLWMSWGLRPQAFVGHSIGEYTAACLAGVFKLEDALKIVAARGRLMQDMPPGAMLAVFLPEDDLFPFMNVDLSLSVINSPSICVVSGDFDAVKNLEKHLSEKQAMCRSLHTSHAFHSKMMDPALQPFMEQIKKVELSPPKMPFLSNVSGTWITEEEATSHDYWARHLRNTVRFSDCLKDLFREPNRVLMEVGPGNVLNILANQHPAMEKSHVILSSMRHPKVQQSDSAFIMDTLCALWRSGVQIDWTAFHSREKGQRIPLPSYPFERKQFWAGAEAEARTGSSKNKIGWIDRLKNKRIKPVSYEKKIQKDRQINEPELQRIWSRALGISSIGVDDNFFQLGGHSLLAVSIITELEKTFGIRLSLASLIEAPTIKEFMRLLEDKKSGSASPYLVPLHAEGAKPPFFLLHSHGGNILEYHSLANLLKDDRPVYAIQCRGLMEVRWKIWM